MKKKIYRYDEKQQAYVPTRRKYKNMDTNVHFAVAGDSKKYTYSLSFCGQMYVRTVEFRANSKPTCLICMAMAAWWRANGKGKSPTRRRLTAAGFWDVLGALQR